MKHTDKLFILAFTDNPSAYKNFQRHSRAKIRLCQDLECFFKETLSSDFSGMILEMKKVMATPARERNKIFALAADRPIMRTKLKKGLSTYVDDPDSFLADCVQKRKAHLRQHDRVNVNLNVMISHEDDHAMAAEFNAEIINISESGCYLKTTTDLSDNHLINIKINQLSNKLPICGGIRWRTIPKRGYHGYGIQFIRIAQDQSAQLAEQIIKPRLKTAPTQRP